MRLSTFHIVLTFLLALFYVSERAVPCMDMLDAGHTDQQEHVESHLHGDDLHDHGDSHESESHGCSHCSCSCPCHVPAISAASSDLPAPIAGTDSYRVADAYPPLSSVNPPDHIPLV